MDSNLNTLKILKSINNLKRYFIKIGEAIKGLENLDLSEVAKESTSKEILNKVKTGGGSIYPTIQMEETTAAIEPNKVYIWGEIEQLDISLIAGEKGIANIYFLEFFSSANGTTIKLPYNIEEIRGTVKKNKINNIAIYNNIAYIA